MSFKHISNKEKKKNRDDTLRPITRSQEKDYLLSRTEVLKVIVRVGVVP